MAELGASKDVGEEVDLVLNVLLRSQASEVATHKDIEVDLCSYEGVRSAGGGRAQVRVSQIFTAILRPCGK